MKLKVVISCSRILKDLEEKVEKAFALYCRTAGMDTPEITFCRNESYFLGDKPMQCNYNDKISECDVFVCLSVLKNQIGKVTAEETYIAYRHYINDGHFPLCLLLSPKEKIEKPFNAETDILISTFLDELNKISPKGLHESENDYYHYFFDYDNVGDIIGIILEQMNKAQEFPLFRLRKLSAHGKEILPKDIMPDSRATAEQGYNEKYFYRTKVDGALNKLLENGENKIVLIKGKALSGKSRAVYQYIKRNLKEERIVVVRKDNLESVMECLFLKNHTGLREEIAQKSSDKFYFVFDEVDKLIGDEKSKEGLKKLFKCIHDPQSSYYAILTSTISGAKKLEDDDVLPKYEFQYYKSFEIAPLDDKKREDKLFIDNCLACFGLKESHADTVGMFNPALQHSIWQRINSVQKEEDESYFYHIFRTYALLQIYSFYSAHYMGIFLYNVKKLMGEEWNAGEIIKYLNKLIEAGILRISRGEGTDKSGCLKRKDLVPEQTFTLEGTSNTMIVKPGLLYTVDDSVWETIQQEYTDDLNEYLEGTIDDFLSVNSDGESYCKTITRSHDKNRAWKYMKDKYLGNYLSNENVSAEEKSIFMNIMIQYAPSWGELNETMKLMKEKYGYEHTGDTLAALLSIYVEGKKQKKDNNKRSQNLFSDEDLKKVLDYEAELRAENSDVQLTYYYHLRKIQLKDSFKDMWSYLHENNILASLENEEENKGRSPMEKKNLVGIFHHLFNYVQLPGDFQQLLEICQKNGIEIRKYYLVQITKKNRNNVAALKKIGTILLGDRFPADIDGRQYLSIIKRLEDKSVILDYIVGNLIKNSPDFKTAYEFFGYLPDEYIMNIQLSQLFMKCKKSGYNFNIAKNLLEKMIEKSSGDDSLIYLNNHVFNTLIKQANTLEGALSVVNLTDKKDNYTLNNYLGIAKSYVIKDLNTNGIRRKILSDVKALFEEMSSEGIIQSGIFQGVKIDLHTINSLYVICYECTWDISWVDTLVNFIDGMKDRRDRNIVYYTLQVRYAKNVQEIENTLRQYILRLNAEDTSEMELRKSDVLNSIYSWLRYHSINKEEEYQLKELLKDPAFDKVEKDHHWLATYFTYYNELIFTSDMTSLSEEFKNAATSIELTSSRPFAILIKHFARNYEEMRLIYDFVLSLLRDKKALFQLDAEYMIEIIRKCETDNYAWITSECENWNVPMTYSLWRRATEVVR
jgi:hypothetical protein